MKFCPSFWIDIAPRHLERLRKCRDSCFVAQFRIQRLAFEVAGVAFAVAGGKCLFGCLGRQLFGRKALLAQCPAPDILITNAGGPPPGDFKDFTLDDWRKAVEGNMITPIALIHSTVYGMMERGFGRIVNITSQTVKAPIASLELSNGARLGLTGAVAVLARKAAARNVTINGILPGPFATDRLITNNQKAADARKVPQVVAAGRGNIAEKIMQLAFDNDIKVKEDAALAEMLAAVELESPIPSEAFMAIAEILYYVYRANGEPNPFDAVLRDDKDDGKPVTAPKAPK